MAKSQNGAQDDEVGARTEETLPLAEELEQARQAEKAALEKQRRLAEEIRKLASGFSQDADKTVGDPEEFARNSYERIRNQVRGYRPAAADALLTDILDVASALRWAQPSAPLRSLARKLLALLSDLAKESSFAQDVDALPESGWWLLAEEIAAAHAAQWTPEGGLSEAERAQLVNLLLAQDLTGRSRFIELPLPQYFSYLGPEDAAALEERVASSQLPAGAPLRLAAALSRGDVEAALREWGREPQSADEYWALILRLMDWELDEQVVEMCRRALELSPGPQLREHLEAVLGEAEGHLQESR